MRWGFLISILLLLSCTEEKEIFETIRNQSEIVDKFLQEKDKYEVQILYTQIDRDEHQNPKITSHTFNYDSTQYFYPASTVKMPVAFLALQRMNELGLPPDAIMRIDSVRPPQTKTYVDTSSSTGFPSVSHFIEKIFAVSDNDAYNRLYEFLGQDYINNELQEKEIFTNSRIVTRVGVSGFTTEDNRYTNPVSFYDQNEKLLHQQNENKSTGNYFKKLNNTLKGKGYYADALDSIIYEQFEMGQKNFINLKDLEASLMRVVLPEMFVANESYDLGESDYSFLYHTMQKRPREHNYLADQTDAYYDSYVKFFLFGDSKEQMPDHIKILNKVGFAYGYLTDCAYIIDLENGIEFFLTAMVHVNENQIYNDGKYEYDEGIKFLAELGKGIYQIEKDRERKFLPDLTRYMKQN